MSKTMLQKLRKSPFLRRTKRLRNLGKTIFWSFLRALTYRRGVPIRVGGKDTLRLNCTFLFSRYETWGQRHNDGFDKLLEICKDKQTVLDIGAHIGLCALPVSKVIAPTGKVHAIEPAQSNYQYLNQHIQYNKIPNIKTYSLLIGESNQENVPFYESDEATGMNSIIQYKTLASAQWQLRQQMRLDDFCEKHNITPDVIKIDVEGAEMAVLRGAQEVLSQHQPIIVLSVHPNHLKQLGEDISELPKIARDLGYSLQDMAGNDVTAFELKEYLLAPVKSPLTV